MFSRLGKKPHFVQYVEHLMGGAFFSSQLGVIVLLVRNLALASRDAACGKAFQVTWHRVPTDLTGN